MATGATCPHCGAAGTRALPAVRATGARVARTSTTTLAGGMLAVRSRSAMASSSLLAVQLRPPCALPFGVAASGSSSSMCGNRGLPQLRAAGRTTALRAGLRCGHVRSGDSHRCGRRGWAARGCPPAPCSGIAGGDGAGDVGVAFRDLVWKLSPRGPAGPRRRPPGHRERGAGVPSGSRPRASGCRWGTAAGNVEAAQLSHGGGPSGKLPRSTAGDFRCWVRFPTRLPITGTTHPTARCHLAGGRRSARAMCPATVRAGGGRPFPGLPPGSRTPSAARCPSRCRQLGQPPSSGSVG